MPAHGPGHVPDPAPLRHLDLFSGIGGFALAARMAGGFRATGYCEIDPFCHAVLTARMADGSIDTAPIHPDIRTLDHDQIGPIDIITGGYPCQPFSSAGQRGGAADDRHLWPAMLEAVKRQRPGWVLAENVAGHVTLGLDDVLADLEAEGYTARPLVIPACAAGAGTRRDRTWILGNAAGVERQQAGQPEIQGRKPAAAGTAGQPSADMAPLRARQHEFFPDRDRPSDRISEPRLDGGVDGISPTLDAGCLIPLTIPDEDEAVLMRRGALGNAIVPQVAARLLRVIRETERGAAG